MGDGEFVVAIGLPLREDLVARLRREFPRVRFCRSRDKAELRSLLANADCLFAWPRRWMLKAAPRLRWIHIPSTGLDFVDFSRPEIEEQGIVVTNSRGVATGNVAEHALAMMLVFSRGLHAARDLQRTMEWPRRSPVPLFELAGQTIGIVGYWRIGAAIASKSGALGMQVLCANRSRVQCGGGPSYGLNEISEMAKHVDHLVSSLPGVKETDGLLDGTVFRAMPDSGYFYNVGRGSVVNECDLIAALNARHIAGAGLDVVSEEPLPRDSPLWKMSNVLLTFHTAGDTALYWERGTELFADNLRRYLVGSPLRNNVTASLAP